MDGKNEQGWDKEGLNPGESQANKQFGTPRNSTADDLRSQEGDVNAPGDNDDVGGRERSGEDQPQRPSRAKRATNAVASGVGRFGAASAAATAFNFIMGHKQSSSAGATIILAIIVVVFTFISPTAILPFVKESLSRWFNHFGEVSTNRRLAKIGTSRYMGFPACEGSRFKCRHQKGVNAKEAERFKKAGIELEDKFERGGKTFYGKMIFTDADGRRHTVTAQNFEKMMRAHPVFKARMNKIITARSILSRSAAALKKMARYAVNRKNPAGNHSDSSANRLKTLRKYFYSSTERIRAHMRNTNVPDEDADGNRNRFSDQARNSFDNLSRDADAVNERAVNGRLLPGDIPNARGLLRGDDSYLRGAARKAASITKGAVGGAIKGVLAGADSYCRLYQLVRIISLTSKVYMAIELFRYAMMFMTEGDRLKEGDGGGGQVASDVADILLRPSTAEGSEGLTFSDSGGWILPTQGAVVDREAMMRFMTGGALMLMFGRLKKAMELGGAISPATCKHINSWYGQAGMLVGGLITSFLTAGGGILVGALTGVAKSLIEMAVLAVAIPMIVAMAGKATIPDPENDPEGGYGAGNALGAGAAVIGAFTAKANGIPPATEAEVAQVQKDNFVDIQTALAADAINDREKGIFNPDNPMSFQSQMAGALLPYSSKIIATRNIASTILSGGALVQNAFSTIPNMFTRTAGAINDVNPDSLKFYRGDACPDEAYIEMGIARTATCAEIRTDSDTSASFAQVKEDLEKGGYIDNEEPNDEMQKFHEVCNVSDDYPLDPSGLNVDGTNSDGKMCFSKERKYQLFYDYYQYEPIDDSIDKAGENNLGLENATDASGGDTEGVNREDL